MPVAVTGSGVVNFVRVSLIDTIVRWLITSREPKPVKCSPRSLANMWTSLTMARRSSTQMLLWESNLLFLSLSPSRVRSISTSTRIAASRL